MAQRLNSPTAPKVTVVKKSAARRKTEPSNGDGPFVVGVGASAGGLQALQAFFGALNESVNAAFVVIQHLSPDFKSFMVELLTKHTRMKVQRAEHNARVEPGNIYLRRDGSPVLIDFGAARQAIGERGRNATGMVTPGYAPFEQYLADDKQGPWSDIYALGATMYHCVTGVAPVASTERVAAVHAGEPDPMAGIGGTLKDRYSAAFLEAMRWMLQPMPMDRPQSVDQALAALGTATNDVPASERSATAADTSTVAADGIDLDIDTLTAESAETRRLTPDSGKPLPATLQRALATLRAWSGDNNRRWALAGLAAAGLGGLIVAAFLLFKSSPTATPPSTAEPDSPTARAGVVAPPSLLKQAEPEIAASNWGNVTRLADEALGKDPKHAEALLLKGHVAYYRDKQTGTALQRYGEALRLKPGLKADPRVVANLVRAVDTVGVSAATLLAQYPSPAAAKLLAERTGKPGFAARRQAADILARWNERKKIDVRKLVLLDLEEAPECPQRREAVVKIRELKLKEALPALKKMADVSFLERVFTNHPNACLFDEAKKTIAVLEGVAG